MSKIPKHLASLCGEIETISMMALRRSPGVIMTAVECGKVFIISRAGKEIAVLCRVPGEQLTTEIDSVGNASYSL